MTTRPDEDDSTGLVAFSARLLRRSRTRLLLLALVLQGGACATVTYPGPGRPSSQVAIVDAKDVEIDEIDGRDVRGKGPKFEVLPGAHTLVVSRLMSARDSGFAGPSVPLPFCVAARPKHDYQIETTNGGSLWRPVVLDEATGLRVPPCGPVAADHHDDFPCAGQPVEVSLASGVQRLTGCGRENVYGYDLASGQWKSVTEQAMFDLNCPGHDLAVHHLGGAAVSVMGCGRRADYVASTACADGLCTFQGWVPNAVAPR